MRTLVATGIKIASGTGVSGTLGSGPPARLYGVSFQYDAAAPNTTTITLTNQGRQIFASPATNTPTYYPILEYAWSATGTPSTQFTSAATNNVLVEAFVNGDIAYTIANSTVTTGAGFTITAYVYDGD